MVYFSIIIVVYFSIIIYNLGLGGTYNLSENAFVQARYTMSLTNTFKGDGNWKNSNIQFAFGMKF